MTRFLRPRLTLLALVIALGGCTSTEEQLKTLDQKAALGDANAQFALGQKYLEGDGVDPDPVRAASLFRQAAEAGDHRAQLALGLLYREGAGVPQDPPEAVRWIRRSAESGNARARFVLGSLYEEGEGVQRDVVAAHAWFNLAAASLPPEERERAARRRDWLAEVMTPAQVAEAQRLAREWARIAK